ncbi:MAG: cysteine synthase A [Gammaproteobacteria bacterium]|nr:cysteine synthase A [Gammaproteobacteria bacterium]NNC96922.1 cysteine synthase A [Gammaproteobacteria bacterium]NNM13337.1 cysteine synthase A [Gammaproteobacteria bacterium]
MQYHNSIIEQIGNTPLIKLHRPSEETGCTILAKCENLNPGGSIKDRTALGLIRNAEEKGLLKPGGTIVEGTAGNTGIGLALVGNALGYKTVIFMPDSQSAEKIDTLRMYGADVRLVPAVPYSNPDQYVHQSERFAKELNTQGGNAVWTYQFDNTANSDWHYRTTGPEIWQQTAGQVDAFAFASGTGGTISGVGRYLKEQNPDVVIALTDPTGSGLCNYYTNGEIKVVGTSITEGIGNSRITGNMALAPIDMAVQISDEESLPIIYDLLEHEGLNVGGSTGVNVAGAMQVANILGPGKTIVTVLCDLGTRYKNKLANPDFLRERNLPVAPWFQ